MPEDRVVRVHLTPDRLTPELLTESVAVVIDVLRATTTIVHALAAGCCAVWPVEEVEEARHVADQMRAGRVLLGGERDGLSPAGFDLGNSPSEYTCSRCKGTTLVLTTTNGTRALLRAAGAARALVAGFVNYSAVCEQLAQETRPVDIVCAGYQGEVAMDDALLAGALVEFLCEHGPVSLNDAARLAWDCFENHGRVLEGALEVSSGGAHLRSLGYDEDIRTAARVDQFAIVPEVRHEPLRIEIGAVGIVKSHWLKQFGARCLGGITDLPLMEMDKLVALCKRRGFLFQSSEIYGGLNGFWDYGPLGVELKRNVKEAWWRDMVSGHDDLATLTGAPGSFEMVGLDCTIIMHPQVWKCSGHYDLFHDYMVDCRESKKRYRHDQVRGRWVEAKGKRIFVAVQIGGEEGEKEAEQRALKFFNLRAKHVEELHWDGPLVSLTTVKEFGEVLGPDAKELGTLTPPREFNLMFKTTVGALGGEEDAAFLRPETAQGIFVNFKNVVDSSRVRIPFGIAQMGKSFRNEITPRNFTFRSREFEQMEIEFFCQPKDSPGWYQFWRDRRYAWYLALGLSGDRLRLRDHSADELSHYSCGTADIEYAFPFLPPGEFGELEGIAHRGDFDLLSHMKGKLVRQGNELVVEMGADGKPRHKGSGKDLSYFDDQSRERYVPHVIEPSAGADRATLAFLCQAYCEDKVPDENGKMSERVVLKLHPRLAPFKAAIFPLVNKDGMPEVAQRLYRELKSDFNVFYDDKGAVGRRYRRQDEAGTPHCFTIDGQTLQDNSVTIRDRDTLKQERLSLAEVPMKLRELLRPQR